MLDFLKADGPAIALLKADHREVDELFDAYEAAKERGSIEQKVEAAAAICDALSVHATIEEEIFYPKVRRVEDTRELVEEALVEHQSLKDIIERLRSAPGKDPLFDAGVKVLQEYVKHHVKEEENELFPRVRAMADLDHEALADEMAARKLVLLAASAHAVPPSSRRSNGHPSTRARRES
jgi:hemerythrin superfamily protein